MKDHLFTYCIAQIYRLRNLCVEAEQIDPCNAGLRLIRQARNELDALERNISILRERSLSLEQMEELRKAELIGK